MFRRTDTVRFAMGKSFKPMFLLFNKTMPRRKVAKISKAQINAKLKGGWFKKLWGAAKRGYKKHVHKHVKRAVAHGKKVARAAAAEAKKVAIEQAKQLLEEGKAQAQEALEQTIAEATEAATQHVRKHVCGAVGSGFFAAEKKKMRAMAKSHFNAVHKKALSHAKSGGKGAGIEAHADKAKARFEKGVDNIKNSAKSKIRNLAGCDQGEGLQMKGAGLRRGAGRQLRGAGVKTTAADIRRMEKLFRQTKKKR